MTILRYNLIDSIKILNNTLFIVNNYIKLS